MMLNKKFYYGYWIVIAAFLCVFISSGAGFFIFSLFVGPLQTDFGWSRGSIAAAFTIYYLVYGVASLFVGRLVDRYGVRGVAIIGAIVGGLGFVLLSRTSTLWQFYIYYAIVAIGMTATGHVPASAVVSNWFKKRRGLALGVMSTGLGVGGFAMTPLIGGYVIPNFGWSAAYLVVAIITWVIITPLMLFVIKTKPGDMGLYPDGLEAPEVATVPQETPQVSNRLTLKMALATWTLWMIFISFISSGFGQAGIVQSQVSYLDDIGFPVTIAAVALGGVGLVSAFGKLGFGWLCDRMAAKYACAIGIGLQLLGVIILMNIGPASPLVIIWLYVLIMGLGIGSWLPTMSMLISINFGLVSYGAIFGIVILAHSFGTGIGPLVAGYLHDTFNSYYWAFVIFLALFAISMLAILASRLFIYKH